MRKIGVVTTSRSDYSIYLPVLRKIQADPDLQLHLIVSGMHISSEFGLTWREIEADGFEIGDKVEMLLSSDTPEAIAKSMGLGTMGFAQSYARVRPDILLVLGDRFEMHSAVVAALPFNIPVAHIHGGEITEGAMDDSLRHSITKLSHLHFPSTEEYAGRIRQLGVESWRVEVSGAPSLDNLRELNLLTREELASHTGLRLDSAQILVTYHTVTLEFERTEDQIGELLAALRECGLPVIFTLPNADTNGRVIIRMLQEFVDSNPRAQMAQNLGTQGYFSLMACAAAMVGNSSSGIIESPSFELPVVNIGTRQKGRIRARNVIDVGNSQSDIQQGIRTAIDPEFRSKLQSLCNPYGDGKAAEVIVKRLAQVELGEQLLIKRFADAPQFDELREKTRQASVPS